MKIILFIYMLFQSLILPHFLLAVGCEDCAQTIEDAYMPETVCTPHGLCTDQCGNLTIWTRGGTFYGPDAYTEAFNSVSGAISRINYNVGYVCGLDGLQAGYIKAKMSETSTSISCTGGTYTGIEEDWRFVVWVKECEAAPDKFCIIQAAACPDGSAVGLLYARCEDQGDGVWTPSGDQYQCGDMATFDAIVNGTIDGQLMTETCACNRTQADMDALCSQIFPTDCAIEDCPDDQDCDGVLDDQDLCPDTPRNTAVDQFGCAIEDWPDSDGDGVPDDEDLCDNTLSGDVVGPDGCTIDNPQPAPNPDGGDQDNDNALLEGIIDWLKAIKGDSSHIADDTSDIKDGMNDFLDGMDSSGYSDDPAIRERSESPMTSAFDDWLTDVGNSSGTSFLKDTIGQFSGSSTLCISIAGENVCTDFARWQSEFQAAGTALLMIVTFMSGLYIFRG